MKGRQSLNGGDQSPSSNMVKAPACLLMRMAEAADFDEPYLSEEFLWEYQAIVTNMKDSGLIKFLVKTFMQISQTFG